MTNEKSPYIGLKPFTEEDAAFFFGRKSETQEILDCIIPNPVTLVYSPSGAGKSSLINAGLIPLLKQIGLDVLPIARVARPQNAISQESKNIFIFNTLVQWNAEDRNNRLEKMSLKDFFANTPPQPAQKNRRILRIMIFDQFEEMFTSFVSQKGQRKDFFEQVSEALSADPFLRAVFLIRQEFIADFDNYANTHLQIDQARYHLRPLAGDAALQAIVGPVQGTSYQYEDRVAEKLLEELQTRSVNLEDGTKRIPGDFVEPVVLQVVCQKLWEGLKPQDRLITLSDVQAFANVNTALSEFYEDALHKTVVATGIGEGALRKWFEQTLITRSGTRGTVHRDSEHTGGIPNAAVIELEKQHIIRSELRAGAHWYELIHDRLIAPIQESNQKARRSGSESEQYIKTLEEKATAWSNLRQSDEELLPGVNLERAENWLKDEGLDGMSHSQTLVAFIHASRAQVEKDLAREQTRSKRRVQMVATALFLTTLIAMIMFFVARNAQAEKEIALKQAQADKLTAEDKTKEAERQKGEKEIALIEKEIALQQAQADKQRAQENEGKAREAERQKATALEEKEIALKQAQADKLTAEDKTKEAEEQKGEKAKALIEKGIALLQAEGDKKRALEAGDIIKKTDRDTVNSEKVFRGHKEKVNSAAFIKSGDSVVSVSEDGVAWLWKVNDPDDKEKKELKNSNDNSLTTEDKDAEVKGPAQINEATNDKVSAQANQIVIVNHAAEKAQLAIARNGGIEIWEKEGKENDYQKVQSLPLGDKYKIFSIAFSPDGKRLVSAGSSGRDQIFTVWDVNSGKSILPTKTDHGANINSVAFGQIEDGKKKKEYIATASDDGNVQVWKISSKNATEYEKMGGPLGHGKDTHVKSVAFSPDGKTILTTADNGDVNGKAHIWSWTRKFGKHTAELRERSGLFSGPAWPVRGFPLNILMPLTFEIPRTSKTDLKPLSGAVFFPFNEATYIATAGEDQIIKIWKWKTSRLNKTELITELRGHTQGIKSIAISPYGRKILTTGKDGTVRLWDPCEEHDKTPMNSSKRLQDFCYFIKNHKPVF